MIAMMKHRLMIDMIYVKWVVPAGRFIMQVMMIAVIMTMHGCGDPDVTEPVKETGTVTDIEGNTYKTIKIGNQWWMAENLKVTHFADGQELSEITDKGEWANTSAPAFCHFNNTESGAGLLYNFHVVANESEIAPYGWHVATDEDWKILEEFIGMPADELDNTNWRGTTEGDQLKEESTSTTGWFFYDNTVWGNNASGFSAVGGSCRVYNGEWGIPVLRYSGFWWTDTSKNGYGWFRNLDYKKSGIFRFTANPNYGFSIRCVKNN